MKPKGSPVTFKNTCAQGDVMFVRIEKIPESAKPAASPVGPVVVGHSETGHHHAFVHGGALMFECDPPDPLRCYLRIAPLDDAEGAVLEHLRPWDTHAPILFAPGDYEVHRQREQSPAGWVRVSD